MRKKPPTYYVKAIQRKTLKNSIAKLDKAQLDKDLPKLQAK